MTDRFLRNLRWQKLAITAAAGLVGNTLIPFADMNNLAVADLLSEFLRENGLDKYAP